MIKANLTYHQLEWDELAAEFAVKGATFPVDTVRRVVLGELVGLSPVPNRVLFYEGCRPTEECQTIFDRVSQVRNDLEHYSEEPDWSPDHLAGLDWLVYKLKIEVICAQFREITVENLGWRLGPNGQIEQVKNDQATRSRKKQYLNVVIPALFEALRPAFQEGWPEVEDKNPELLRKHISKILSPLLPNHDLSEKAHHPIWQAIDNHHKSIDSRLKAIDERLKL